MAGQEIRGAISGFLSGAFYPLFRNRQKGYHGKSIIFKKIFNCVCKYAIPALGRAWKNLQGF